MTSLIPVTSEPTWVIDPTSPAEQVRRMQWGRMMNEVLGLFPRRLDLTHVYRILEIGCGVGEWTLQAAHSFPVAYIGIDASPTHIASARLMARTVHYDDLLYFEQVNLTERLPFADRFFDLVHVRFLATSLPSMQWPQLLQEAWRVLRGNGVVLLSEAEWPLTNSQATQQFASFVTQALWKVGYGFSTDGQTLGIAHALPTLLQQSDAHAIEHQTYHLNFSADLPLHRAMLSHLWVTAHLMQPFLTHLGCGSQHDLSTLAEQIVAQGHCEEFVGSMTITQTWAHKK